MNDRRCTFLYQMVLLPEGSVNLIRLFSHLAVLLLLFHFPHTHPIDFVFLSGNNRACCCRYSPFLAFGFDPRCQGCFSCYWKTSDDSLLFEYTGVHSVYEQQRIAHYRLPDRSCLYVLTTGSLPVKETILLHSFQKRDDTYIVSHKRSRIRSNTRAFCKAASLPST